MNKASYLLTGLLLIASASFSQYNRNEGVTISPLFQIDSSEFFTFGKLIDNSTKSRYGASIRIRLGYTNVFIYNSVSKKMASLFPNKYVLIYSFHDNFYNINYTYGQSIRQSVILKDHVIFLVHDTDLNTDGMIDEDDPISIYIAYKNGDSLRKVSADDLNVVSWSFSRDSRVILFTAQKDNNNDRKFTGEDHLLFQIDLKEEISKIKPHPVLF